MIRFLILFLFYLHSHLITVLCLLFKVFIICERDGGGKTSSSRLSPPCWPSFYSSRSPLVPQCLLLSFLLFPQPIIDCIFLVCEVKWGGIGVWGVDSYYSMSGRVDFNMFLCCCCFFILVCCDAPCAAFLFAWKVLYKFIFDWLIGFCYWLCLHVFNLASTKAV